MVIAQYHYYIITHTHNDIVVWFSQVCVRDIWEYHTWVHWVSVETARPAWRQQGRNCIKKCSSSQQILVKRIGLTLRLWQAHVFAIVIVAKWAPDRNDQIYTSKFYTISNYVLVSIIFGWIRTISTNSHWFQANQPISENFYKFWLFSRNLRDFRWFQGFWQILKISA